MMAKTSPLEFLQQVSAETAKVVWPTRRETGITTLMVVIFAFVASIFFFLVDFIIRNGVSALLSYIGGVSI
ncbi:preprotein translocase subunit SecE [Methylopila sp. M107]|uniref:preprotein translocase subunit SecE n=1 Tax=Methylopila sp. M107 TaxID=1101190 RepID=UPI0009DC197D|nr:preprotein translocase subunit SecE [Methylopila sp. M107]